MFVALAISSFIFGGLHCVAWKFGFPTKIELMIWMVLSVLSATLPLLGLVSNLLTVRLIGHRLHESADRFKARSMNLDISTCKPVNSGTPSMVDGISQPVGYNFENRDQVVVSHGYLTALLISNWIS
jgi:hypothetical protein